MTNLSTRDTRDLVGPVLAIIYLTLCSVRQPGPLRSATVALHDMCTTLVCDPKSDRDKAK